MTGYSVEALQELVPYFEQAHNEYLSRYHLNGKRRSGLRQFVLYANSPLPSVAERLAFHSILLQTQSLARTICRPVWYRAAAV